MELDLLITVLTSISSFTLGLFILLKNPKSSTHVYFSLLLFVIGLYPVFNYLSLHSESASTALIWAKLILFSAIPAGPLFYFFVRVFPGNQFIFNFKLQLGLLCWVIVNFFLAYFGLIFQSVDISGGNVQITSGPAVASFGLLQAGGVLLGIFALIIKYRGSQGFYKKQLELIVSGVSISFGLTLLATLILPLFFNFTGLVALSPLFLFLGASAVGLSIIRNQLFDIKPILIRTVSFMLVLTIFAFFHSTFIFIVSSLFFSQWIDIRSVGITISLAIISAFTFQPLIKFITRITEEIFYQDFYDVEKLIHSLTLIMASTLLLEDLARSLLHEIVKTLKVNRASLLLTEDGHVYQVLNVGDDLAIEIDETEIQKFEKANNVLINEDVTDLDIKKLMRKYGFASVSTLKKEGQTIGILALGTKLSGDAFSTQDVSFLTIFSPEAAVAIQNAKAYEEIRRFNITLEEEVKSATHQLVRANKKLQELDKLKDEFVSIASHELRTPMVSIKNYVWMALAGKGGKVSRKQKFYLERAFESANRMTKLISDLLDISRIESGRIMLNVAKIELMNLVQQIITEVRPRAEQLDVKLVLETEVKKLKSSEAIELPPVVADQDKLAEVLTNFLGNSLKFTPAKGTITISLEVDLKGQQVIIHVADTGVGLAADQIPNLFKKFGMIRDSYRNQTEAAQGSGLGLYISKSIIELHGGKIWVESKGKDKGSIFSFSVPVYSEEVLTHLKKKFNSTADKGIIRTTIRHVAK